MKVMDGKEKRPVLYHQNRAFSSDFAVANIEVSAPAEHNNNTNQIPISQLHSSDFIFSSDLDAVLGELENKFTPKKTTALLLADSYNRIGFGSRSGRVRDCGTWLQFAHTLTDGVLSPEGHLYKANFCRDRLCPLCAWRRSYKIFGQVSQIMNIVQDNYKFLFLTLTVPSCRGSELPKLLDSMFLGFRKFTRYKRIKGVVKGFFRALEVTRNGKTGLYHPHFHVILAVSSDYLNSRYYIKRDDWLDFWKKAMQDNTITQVDIRVARPKVRRSGAHVPLGAVVAEIAKYSVKSSDYIIEKNLELTDEIVSTVMGSLSHRRLVAFGGCFMDAFRSLGLDDPEDGDLVHLDNIPISDTVQTLIFQYHWGVGCYSLTDVFPIDNSVVPSDSEDDLYS